MLKDPYHTSARSSATMLLINLDNSLTHKLIFGFKIRSEFLTSEELQEIKEITMARNSPHISHLFFTDDKFIFLKIMSLHAESLK